MKPWVWTAIGVVVLFLDMAFIGALGFRTVFAGDASGWILIVASTALAAACFWLIWAKGTDRTTQRD